MVQEKISYVRMAKCFLREKETFIIYYIVNIEMRYIYRVILKKVFFGILRMILVSKEEKNSIIESKDKGLSLSKISRYLVTVKIIKIRHSEGHISQTSHDLKNIFMQK